MLLAALAVILTCEAGTAAADPLSISSEERAARERIGERIPSARLLWSRGGRVYHTRLGKWDPVAVTPQDVKAGRPRWSPDGKAIVYERDGDVWIMDSDFTHRRRILENAGTADWTGDGRAITAITGQGYQVVRYALDGGGTQVIFDSRQAPGNGQPLSQAAELHPNGRYLLTFREKPGHSTLVVDLQNRRVLRNDQMSRGDCTPSWSPDGTEILSTARTADRPVLVAPFDFRSGNIGKSVFLAGLDSLLRYYVNDARLSNDGRWLVFDGKVLIGGAMWGGREIYIWPRGAPQSERVRLTFEGDNDWTPSLYVPDA